MQQKLKLLVNLLSNTFNRTVNCNILRSVSSYHVFCFSFISFIWNSGNNIHLCVNKHDRIRQINIILMFLPFLSHAAVADYRSKPSNVTLNQRYIYVDESYDLIVAEGGKSG